MRVESDFLEGHVQAHDGGAAVVQGLIAAAPALSGMPLYEKFHAEQLENVYEEYFRRVKRAYDGEGAIAVPESWETD